MSDTNNPEPVNPEPNTEPVVAPQTSPVSAPTGEGEPGSIPQETPPAPPPSTEPPQVDWRDKRIATLTRRLRELQEKGVSPPVATPPPGTAPEPPLQPPTNLDALVNQRARELAAVQDFNRRCDDTALAGRAAFGESEFNGRIQNLQKLVDNTDPQSVQTYNSLLMAALETGDAARILFDLGADLNEAQRVLAMTPTKMAVELTRKAAMPPAQVSSAPKPITTLATRPGSHERIAPDDPDRSDHLSTAEWMRRREEQLAARRAANGAAR